MGNPDGVTQSLLIYGLSGNNLMENNRAQEKSTLLKIWHKWLFFIFIYFIYHLVRDILQDVLNFHNTFTEFLHYEPDPSKLPHYLEWITFGGYGKWVTFPIDIFILLAIPKTWKSNQFIFLDFLIFSALLFIEIIWLLNFFFR